jgi:hypothetical protein
MSKSKFHINVCLVPFLHGQDNKEEDDEQVKVKANMKIGLLETDLGYSVIYHGLEKGKSSNDILNDTLIDDNFQLDRDAGNFYLLLCDCLDSPNRYIGHASQDALLVFRLDIREKDSDYSPNIKWFGPEELAELAAKKKLVGDTHNTIEAALSYGQGRNQPRSELPTRV